MDQHATPPHSLDPKFLTDELPRGFLAAGSRLVMGWNRFGMLIGPIGSSYDFVMAVLSLDYQIRMSHCSTDEDDPSGDVIDACSGHLWNVLQHHVLDHFLVAYGIYEMLDTFLSRRVAVHVDKGWMCAEGEGWMRAEPLRVYLCTQAGQWDLFATVVLLSDFVNRPTSPGSRWEHASTHDVVLGLFVPFACFVWTVKHVRALETGGRRINQPSEKARPATAGTEPSIAVTEKHEEAKAEASVMDMTLALAEPRRTAAHDVDLALAVDDEEADQVGDDVEAPRAGSIVKRYDDDHQMTMSYSYHQHQIGNDDSPEDDGEGWPNRAVDEPCCSSI